MPYLNASAVDVLSLRSVGNLGEVTMKTLHNGLRAEGLDVSTAETSTLRSQFKYEVCARSLFPVASMNVENLNSRLYQVKEYWI